MEIMREGQREMNEQKNQTECSIKTKQRPNKNDLVLVETTVKVDV